MADENKPADLIQRFAEKMLRDEDTLVERAANKLSTAVVDAESASSDQKDVDAAAVPSARAMEDASRVSPEVKTTSSYTEINLIKLQVAGYLTPITNRIRLAEEYRIVKRPLLLKALSRGEDKSAIRHLIMVTSALPGEGKTFTAINLAMSMASERDLNVLLMDMDVHQQDLAAELGIGEGPGLIDLIVDKNLDLPDVLVRTNVPNLTVLPSGAQHPQATELIASQRMVELMQDLATRYQDRVIVIDTPPVLSSSEPSVLALHVGQILMVVEMGRTSRRAVEQALPLIGGCEDVSFMLNKTIFAPNAERFGSYSYYVYGSKRK